MWLFCRDFYFLASFNVEKGDSNTMENVVPSTAEENDAENHAKTNGEKDEIVQSGNPANLVIDHSNNVTVERIDYDTDAEIKKEDRHEFPVDENESFGEGEPQEDDSMCSHKEYQGRKNISTLTSRHYAGHVRVFKGIIHSFKSCLL